MVFLAVPLGAMEQTFREMVGKLQPDAVITDGGSAKASVIEDCKSAFGELPPGFCSRASHRWHGKQRC